MEEIKKGEYVRLKNGKIMKFDSFGEMHIHNEDNPDAYKDKYGHLVVKTILSHRKHYKYNDVIKHSFNIVDLIEVGDYVNGQEIVDIQTDPFVKGQINLWTDIHLVDVYGDCEKVKYTIDDIESIATKEQFETIKFDFKKYKETREKERQEKIEKIEELKRQLKELED